MFQPESYTVRCLRQYARHTISTKDLKIILIDGKLADVFAGDGWPTPSRYRLMQGRWCYVNGPRLPASQLTYLPVRKVSA